MSTIIEVARRAGVSVKTVSRVMNNYQHISDKTRKKVETAILELNYAPGKMAKDQRIAGTQSVGILFGDPSGGYQSRLNHSILKACAATGRYAVSELFDEEENNWRQQVEAFLNRTNVQNLILVPPMCDSSGIHNLVRDREVRCVLVSPSRPVSGINAVSMDDRLAALEVTNHLIGLGHRNIGHIAGQDGHVATLLRLQGVREAMTMAGLGTHDCWVEAGDFSFRKAIDCAERMLSTPERPTAIFAANDEMAAAVMMVAQQLGLTVPRDLSVVGFDNVPISQRVWPELTTVSQPYDEIAEEATRLLAAQQHSHLPATAIKVLPHRLIIRASTGPVETMLSKRA